MLVRLDDKRRLVLIPSPSTQPIQKKSPELATIFQLLQEVDDAADRIVLVTNVEPGRPPAQRPAALAPDALALLTRLGARHLTGVTLFNLWKVSLQAVDKARGQVEQLHGGEAGTFEVSASLLRLSELRV